MFTVELKVNGVLIGHIYGKNLGYNGNGRHRYKYEYYEPENRTLKIGRVTHDRTEGLTRLVKAIIEDL